MNNNSTKLAINGNADVKGSSTLDALDRHFSVYEESPSYIHRATYEESSSDLAKATSYSEALSPVYTDIIRVAEWFLTHATMSHKKLQKLCYYAYAWFLVFFNDKESKCETLNKICTDGFEAWVHGPVNSTLYNHYKKFGWDDIPMVSQQPQFPADVNDLLEQVWTTYGTFSADQLEQLSHRELPWREARRGFEPAQPSSKKINDNDIFHFYSDMMNNEKE